MILEIIIALLCGVISGTLTSDPLGINCGATCSANFSLASQSIVMLSATSSDGSLITFDMSKCQPPLLNCLVTVNFTLSTAVDNYHPADTDKNWAINGNEINIYNGYYRFGLAWLDGSGVINPSFINNANIINRFGPTYTYNSSRTVPSCWSP